MPLIVVSGLPSSGKSSAAAALADVCRALGQDVVVVDEDSLHLRRNDSYKGEAAVGRRRRRCRRWCLLGRCWASPSVCPHQSTLPTHRCNLREGGARGAAVGSGAQPDAAAYRHLRLAGVFVLATGRLCTIALPMWLRLCYGPWPEAMSPLDGCLARTAASSC